MTTFKFKVTDIQIFKSNADCDGKVRFSANIAINDKFMIQRGTDGEYSIPSSNLANWNSQEEQDYAAGSYNADELAETLKLDEVLEDAKDKPVYQI